LIKRERLPYPTGKETEFFQPYGWRDERDAKTRFLLNRGVT
jgi:hypothetical protein